MDELEVDKMRAFFKLLSLLATVRAASRGPGPLARRLMRRKLHRKVNRL